MDNNGHPKKFSVKILASLLAFALLSGCSMEAAIGDLTSVIDIGDPNQKAQRTTTDFIAGEVVTTGNGAVVMGTFGEISERKTLSNGVEVEGVFYE